MKNLIELEDGIKDNRELKTIAMNLAQELFTKTQENLVEPMPWGDDKESSQRKPSIISDQSTILLSGVPPYWESPTRIVFRYDAPHAKWVEYGTDPHPVAASNLVGWVNRKLNIRDKRAKSVAYAIATKIKKEGMPPHPFIRPAIEQIVTKNKLFRIRVEA